MNLGKKVFVSYAHHDREVAHRLVAALREKLPSTIQVVADTGVLLPGDNLFVRIAETLSQTDALIVIFSEAGSSSNWVRSEIAWALAERDGKLPIFPLLIGSPDAIPHLLKTRVYIDFSDEKKFSKNVTLLVEALLQSLGMMPGQRYDVSAEDIEQKFLELRTEALENLKQRELKIKLAEDARLKLALALLILLLVTTAISLFTILQGFDNIHEVLSIILTPIVGLLGTTFGFYFGQKSSVDLEGTDRQKASQREHEAS